MENGGHRLTAAGRVNEEQMARIDAASRLEQLPRAHFVRRAVLAEADRVLRSAASGHGSDDTPAD